MEDRVGNARLTRKMALTKTASLLQELAICKKEAVVALSGGPDSVALLYVAKQLFENVRAVTVDHKVRAESKDDALKAKSIAHSLGVDHVIVPVEGSRRGSRQQFLRDLRYNALLEHCRSTGSKTLLLGHHMEDQLETFVNRLGNESGLVGLKCMSPVSARIGHLDVSIVRPLLECTKEELKGICTENGLPWVEDSSNEADKYYRNRIRKVLDSQEWIKPSILQLLQSVQAIGRDIDKEALDALVRVVSVDQNFGYARIAFHPFYNLPPPVGKRVLSLVSNHISGIISGNMKNLARVYNGLVATAALPETAASLSYCVVSPDRKANCLLVVRQLTKNMHHNLTQLLQPGESVLWDNRYRISVSKVSHDKHIPFKSLFVRHMLSSDHILAKKGFRRNKRSKRVPPLVSRGGLPIIVDDKGCTVAVPHLGYLDLNYGIKCKAVFEPAIPLSYNLDVD